MWFTRRNHFCTAAVLILVLLRQGNTQDISGTILEQINELGFTDFAAAVQDVGVVDTVNDLPHGSMLLPTNSAMDDFVGKVREASPSHADISSFQDLPSDVKKLIVEFHIIPNTDPEEICPGLDSRYFHGLYPYGPTGSVIQMQWISGEQAWCFTPDSGFASAEGISCPAAVDQHRLAGRILWLSFPVVMVPAAVTPFIYGGGADDFLGGVGQQNMTDVM